MKRSALIQTGIWTAIFVLLSLNANVYSQMTQVRNLDILRGIHDGTIQVTADPVVAADEIDKIFDGNAYTSPSLSTTDTLSLTLQFDNPVKVNKSTVFTWFAGRWNLETANTLDDMINQTGSYQLLIAGEPCKAFAWDSLMVEGTDAAVVRISFKNPVSNGIFPGEWRLGSETVLTSLVILPNPLKLVPNTSLKLEVKMRDENNNVLDYDLPEPVMWTSGDKTIVTIDEDGTVTAHKKGTVLITAKTQHLQGTTTANILDDFVSEKDDPMTIKVAVVYQDPVVDSTNNKRIHQVWGWADPKQLIGQLVEDFNQMSHGVINFQIVEVHDDDQIFTTIDGQQMSIDTLAYYILTPGKLYGRTTPGTMQYMAEIEGRVKFDYRGMCDAYNFGPKRNNGEINEVWVYSFPFGGMYESQLMGPDAFWWNSPPITDYAPLQKLLSVMGWNYERGIAEAIHSVGHRAESAMWKVYQRWDTQNANPNAWELFTRIDKDVPGKAQVGNVHYPPNGQSDYDYSNTRYVTCYADNWKRYPILLDQNREINCTEWGSTQEGYMKWWFGHFPYFKGVTNGVLNNWWYYVVDYEGAVEKAQQLTVVQDQQNNKPQIPQGYMLEQNYPNPFNPTTTITYSLPIAGQVSIKVFDVLGRQVKTLVDGSEKAGSHQVQLDAGNLASGVYFYRMEASNISMTKKMLLMR
ncbi:MAG: T9SS type A sorting domain-containing protein [Calditrichia bacterium]